MDPAGKQCQSSHSNRTGSTSFASTFSKDKETDFASSAMSVAVSDGRSSDIRILDAKGSLLLTAANLFGQARAGVLTFVHDENELLYGETGLDLNNTGAGITRPGVTRILAGSQGNGGAPFVLTKRYGILVDSDGGEFSPRDETLHFNHDSRPDMEFFVIVGPPMVTMQGLATLTGRPPMPPRWTLGFLNSQWGSTEAELRGIVSKYSDENIPLSGFILDFDWKAWGEDSYGEWRWNSTSGPGNLHPNKFPSGAQGVFASDLLSQGVHLAGILKPRILLQTIDGKPTEAAAYATAHHFWYPNEVRENDYFTHRPAGNIDFANPDARKWFWQHLLPAFHAGMTAWWNDEADIASKTVFNNFQFMNMARTLYEGQRSVSDERVWSINRNYYLGAVRYGYAEWSGDIHTGFQSMAFQRTRMVATLDLGEPHWSMDTGGIWGHPTAENYARWIEFASFVPIFRVHGEENEKRQPWVYGPIAEAAARRAIRQRYDMLPYIYANERVTFETGIGLVRPLFWEFPDDAKASEDTRSWMFGDALLVSPIVEHGATSHSLYLPAGTWFNFSDGKQVQGGTDISVPADAANWGDIPVFVRAGSILASQPHTAGNDTSMKGPLTLDIFPSPDREAAFTVYDDDGHTYAYERDEYFRQSIRATRRDDGVEVALARPSGSYRTVLSSYGIRVHYPASKVSWSAGSLPFFNTEAELLASDKPGWAKSKDRFGLVTVVRVPVGQPHEETLKLR
jgi:alpha-glucosidase (family GH31 glycosyl hydrolase)